MSDVQEQNGGGWIYSDEVKDHFLNPRNFVEDEKSVAGAYQGMVGSPACGDVMRVWLKIEKGADGVERIQDMKWKTFGCASAIASTSMLSLMVTENGGMPVERALELKPQDILARLGGLPDRKIHCSVLGDKALRAAINDYFRRTGQIERILVEELVSSCTEKYGEVDMKISKLEVDKDACIGCGTCTTIAPGVFKLDENNKSTVIDVNGADADTALLAAQSCPVQAIKVWDEEGKQIFP